MLLNSPRVQRHVAIVLATELENHIGSRVELGNVHWLFPNDIVIDSLTVDDQEGEQLLSVKRIAAKIEWRPLIKQGSISIRNIRLFAPSINIYKDTPEDEMNYQFLVDAFSKKHKKEKTAKLDLRINSLLIRRANMRYDVRSEVTTPGMLNPSHITISDLSTMLSLKTLTNDSISVILRNMKCIEQSGLHIDDLYLRLVGNHYGATLANFRLKLPHSTLALDTIWASYMPDNFAQSLVVKGALLPSHITPADLQCLLPAAKKITESIHISGEVIGNATHINVKQLALRTHNRDLALKAHVTTGFKNPQQRYTDIDLQSLTITPELWSLFEAQWPEAYKLIPTEAMCIGNITASATAHLSTTNKHISLKAHTDAGDIETNIKIDDKKQYKAHINGTHIDVTRIIPTSPLTRTNIALQTEGTYNQKAPEGSLPLSGTLSATATNTIVRGYAYRKLMLEGKYAPQKYEGRATLNDPNGALFIEGSYTHNTDVPDYTIKKLQADSMDLHAMRLINIHEGKQFSLKLEGDIHGNNLEQLTGKVILDSLTMHDEGSNYLIKQITLISGEPDQKLLALHIEDIADISINGSFNWSSLHHSLMQHLHNSTPSLCYEEEHEHEPQQNLCIINGSIYDAKPIEKLLLIPISIEKDIDFNVLLNDYKEQLEFNAIIPQLTYQGQQFNKAGLSCKANSNKAHLQIEGIIETGENSSIRTALSLIAQDDNAILGVQWNSKPEQEFDGALHTHITLGNKKLHIATDSSHAVINGSRWDLTPFEATLSKEHITVNNFRFDHNNQYLTIDGSIGQHSTDNLCIGLNEIDLDYLLTLIKLKGISFGGKISGQLYASDLYTSTPYLDAKIKAKDLSFCQGILGDATAHAWWNCDSTRLEFIADVNEVSTRTTQIEGYANGDRLHIGIDADSTNLAFLNGLLGNFMHGIEGNATGRIVVGGPMDAIDLNGNLYADAKLTVTSTNVEYKFTDSLYISPGIIAFNGLQAYDHLGNQAKLNGTVTHEALKDFAYDLNIAAQNILGIDLPDTGDDNFYTTIYGTGTINISGSPTQPLNIAIQANPEKNSLFALNIGEKSGASSESFITFRDAQQTDATTTKEDESTTTLESTTQSAEQTTISINTSITPDATLKLVMNQAVDDHINASGSGELRINIVGDDINLFGTYTVTRGFYRLSLQDVINKNFEIVEGSTVTFEGDPMTAKLDITASHTVSYVPLKDLSAEATGNVRVNCLLSIKGTLSAPDLTFSLELPQGTEEQKSLLRSYTSTEEQTNLQFIYLLGLGKFYTMDLAQQELEGGATGTMESFISTTISGQINNLLSSIISNDNWNFASNIRTENLMGQQGEIESPTATGTGFENMEIEGMLEGRMLNNRLLINGNFGYRDNPMYASNFIGDFDLRYMLTNDLSVKWYNKTNDRYFSKTALNTQGIGLLFQHDFDYIFPRNKKTKKSIEEKANKRAERKAARKAKKAAKATNY